MSLINKVDQFGKDSDIAHRLVHGSVHEIIQTEGGPLPSFAGALGGITDVPKRLKALEDGQGADRIVKRLWSQLQAIATSAEGARAAEVVDDDGTHLDPVTHQLVANNGLYTEDALGWSYVRPETLSGKADRRDVAVVAGELFHGAVSGGLLECDVDDEYRVSSGLHPDGGREFMRVQVGGFNVRRSGDKSAEVTGRYLMHGVYEEFAFTFIDRFADALIVEVDDWMRVGRIVWRDGSVWTAQATQQADATLLEMISLPDGALAQNPNGGFTCTGLDRFTGGPWSYCWAVGNHGLARAGSGQHTPSVVILSPDMRRIVRELPCTNAEFPGIGSIQGVAIRRRDNTIYFVDKANSCIRRISSTGQRLPGDIPVAHTPNGIAYHPGLDALYTAHEGEKLVSLVDCETGAVIWTKQGFPSNADQLSYYAADEELLATVGSNGGTGSVHIYDANSLALKRSIPLPGAEAIEGVYREGDIVTTVNDGAYHLEAKPALSLACKHRIS